MQAFTEREPFRIWCSVADRTGHGTHFMRHTHINSYWNLSFWLFDRNLLATQRKWPNMCTQQIPYPNYTNSIDLARSFGYSGIIVASYARIHFLNWFSLDSRFCSLHLFPFFRMYYSNFSTWKFYYMTKSYIVLCDYTALLSFTVFDSSEFTRHSILLYTQK